MERRVIYEFAEPPYSLHDATVSFNAKGETLTLTTEYGMKRRGIGCVTSDGRVEISGVDWSACTAYILPYSGHLGVFKGEKLTLTELLERDGELRLDILDEHFGRGCARYCGFAEVGGELRELAVEVWYSGNMEFATSEE